MIKWRLMLTTVPFPAVVVGIMALRDKVFEWNGLVEFSDVAFILTAAAFIIGFMLSGTLSDFKESEKIPAELAGMLERLDEAFTLTFRRMKGVDHVPARQAVLELSETIRDWLYKKKTLDDVLDSLHGLDKHVLVLDSGGAVGNALDVMDKLRRMLLRMDVISRTSFLQTGYALVDVLVTGLIGLMMISRFKSPITYYLVPTIVTLVYVYMLRLIRDIDDPFEYAPDGKRGGAAEVDLYPLLTFIARSQRSLS